MIGIFYRCKRLILYYWITDTALKRVNCVFLTAGGVSVASLFMAGYLQGILMGPCGNDILRHYC